MNKKVIMVFIIFFAVFLAIGSVSAANMVNKNFDGFSMDVPKNVDFKKETNSSAKEDFQMEPDPILRDSYKRALENQEHNLKLCEDNIYNCKLIDQNDYVKEVAKLIRIEEIKKMPLDLYREALDINTGGYKLRPNNKKQD